MTKNRILVYLIERHPLAAKTAVSVLKYRGLETIVSKEGSPNKLRGNGDQVVFVVDATTIATDPNDVITSLRKRLRPAQPRIVVIYDPSLISAVLECFPLGVLGFVACDRALLDLPQAIRAVAQGCMWIDASLAAALAQEGAFRCERRTNLTLREENVLQLLTERRSNKEIATELGVSIATVKFHLGNLFAKLGVHDRYSAVDKALAKHNDLA